MTSRFMQIFSLKISLDKLYENTGFYLPIFCCMRTESVIMSLYDIVQVSENPYFPVFHAVHITKNNTDPYLAHFLE